MKKKKSPPIRKRKLDIKNEANRTMEQKGFDDMAAIMLGDESKLIHTQPSRISEQDTQSSGSFYEIIKKEDAYNRRLKLILGIVLVVSVSLILGISMFIKYRTEQTDGKIRVNYSSSDFEGNNYEQVISQLEKQGFTNIKTQKIDDLVTGWITKDGEVEEVKIDGYSSFSTNSRFAPDVEIIVSYHTFSEK